MLYLIYLNPRYVNLSQPGQFTLKQKKNTLQWADQIVFEGYRPTMKRELIS